MNGIEGRRRLLHPQVMLSLLMDIKNNRVRGGAARCVVLSTGTTKWLKAAEAPSAALPGLTWAKLLSPSKKARPHFFCAAL